MCVTEGTRPGVCPLRPSVFRGLSGPFSMAPSGRPLRAAPPRSRKTVARLLHADHATMCRVTQSGNGGK
jgi:hypothetical protein